jgi:hypothetical protein
MKKDSKEEGYFIDYLEELKERKIVKGYKRAPSFNLTKSVEKEYAIEKQDSYIFKKFKLLNEPINTPHFEIEFVETIYGFVENETGLTSAIKDKNKHIFICSEKIALVETKADYVDSNELRCFKINQKLMYDKYGMYINFVQIPKIFKQTFVPNSYLLTEKKKQERKLNFKPTLIDEFIQNI